MVGILTLLPAAVQSQVTFEWKTARRDSLYATVEECLGLMERVDVQTSAVDTMKLDLRPLPFRLRVEPNTTPDTTIKAARYCSQKFTAAQFLAPDSLNYARVLNAIKLFLKAKRDADVLALVEGWGAKLPASQDTVKNQLRYEVAMMALYDLPTRFALIRRLADSIEFTRFWEWKIRVNGEMLNRSRMLKDTAQYEASVAWLLPIPKALGDSLMKSDAWLGNPGGGYSEYMPLFTYVQQAQSYANRAMVLAKLRENVDSFRVFNALLRKELGLGDGTANSAVANPLIADFWFPEKPATRRPMVPGKVSVVYRIKNNVCYPTPCYHADNSWGMVAKKFPEIEFTGLMKTWGHYGQYFGTLPPAQEAKLLDSFHRKVAGFPGFLAIQNTQFWRIDEQYDRRQVEEPGPNEEHYPLMVLITPPLVIDWNGHFVDVPDLDMDPDMSLELYFEALLRSKPK